MSRISSHTEKRIAELWFQGIPRDEIANKLCVSGSTVSKIVNQLPESIRELRGLSNELRKQGLSPSEAKEGAKLISKLTQLDIRPNRLASYIEASTKISRKAGFEPAQVVRGTMTLSNLEAKAGKSYFEVLREFEARIKRNRSLKDKNRELEGEVKQKLDQNKVTENEIKYITELRKNLDLYGVDLGAVETLQHYLQNMHQTNGDPTKFTEYTRRHGSLEERLASLEKQARAKTEVLQIFQHKIENYITETNRCVVTLSSLKEEIYRAEQNLKTLHRQGQQTQARIQEKLSLLSSLLEVETEGETIKEALDSAREKLNTLNASAQETKQTLHARKQSIQEVEIKKQNLERKIVEMLKIEDYIEEKQAAITRLEDLETSLEREFKQKSERLALSDTITNFLTRQSLYDFNVFYAYVQDIKHKREPGFPSRPEGLPILEEKVRRLALKAFEGDLVSKTDYQESQSRKNDLETEVAEKNKEIEETRRQIERVTNENEILEAVKLSFEGRSSTLAELRKWVAKIYFDEIEKRANEKYSLVGAGFSGILDFISNKFTNKENTK